MTTPQVGQPKNRGSIPSSGKGFPSSPKVHTGSVAHPVSYPKGRGGFFPGGKAARA